MTKKQNYLLRAHKIYVVPVLIYSFFITRLLESK